MKDRNTSESAPVPTRFGLGVGVGFICGIAGAIVVSRAQWKQSDAETASTYPTPTPVSTANTDTTPTDTTPMPPRMNRIARALCSLARNTAAAFLGGWVLGLLLGNFWITPTSAELAPAMKDQSSVKVHSEAFTKSWEEWRQLRESAPSRPGSAVSWQEQIDLWVDAAIVQEQKALKDLDDALDDSAAVSTGRLTDTGGALLVSVLALLVTWASSVDSRNKIAFPVQALTGLGLGLTVSSAIDVMGLFAIVWLVITTGGVVMMGLFLMLRDFRSRGEWGLLAALMSALVGLIAVPRWISPEMASRVSSHWGCVQVGVIAALCIVVWLVTKRSTEPQPQADS